ncbi:hypothetical protein GCM10009830_13730 [Glycomyces endophyticus]|uniref:Uncharacterized protein n=1 Tax=Glycomyces endophyticus TaxID=480996 RepID=A0ABN2GCY7_9ACTN
MPNVGDKDGDNGNRVAERLSSGLRGVETSTTGPGAGFRRCRGPWLERA